MNLTEEFIKIAGDNPVWGLTITKDMRILLDTKDPDDVKRTTITNVDIPLIIKRLDRTQADCLYITKTKDEAMTFKPMSIPSELLFFHGIFERYVENQAGVQASILLNGQGFSVAVIPPQPLYAEQMVGIPWPSVNPDEWENKELSTVISSLMSAFGGVDWVTILNPNEILPNPRGLLVANLYEPKMKYVVMVYVLADEKKETRQ